MQINQLIAGDTLNFATAVADYLASDGWVLKYRLVPRTGSNTVIDISSAADGDDHRVQISAGVTSGWAADSYTWSSWVEKGAEKYSVDTGQLTIKADPRTAQPGYDGRSLAAKALEDARAAFANYSTTGGGIRRRYKIGEREMEFNSAQDIITQIQFWRGEVEREDIEAGRKSKTSGRILTRL